MSDATSSGGHDIGLIEKAFLMGIGAASIAKEKAQELADELVRRGAISREQSESFANRLAEEAEEAGRSAQSTVIREGERAIAAVGLASGKDVASLRAELTEIKALLASMRPVGPGPVEADEVDEDEFPGAGEE